MTAKVRGSDSTRTAEKAPRERASRPSAPVPANRSSTLAPSVLLPRMLKTASRTRSAVGRTDCPLGERSSRPRHFPDTMRTFRVRACGQGIGDDSCRPPRTEGRQEREGLPAGGVSDSLGVPGGDRVDFPLELLRGDIPGHERPERLVVHPAPPWEICPLIIGISRPFVQESPRPEPPPLSPYSPE